MSISFSTKLSSLRREKGITQKSAADDLGISQALLSHYEKGIRECNLDFVVKAAVYYDVSTDYLLGLTENKNGNTDLSDMSEIQSDTQIKSKTLLRCILYLLQQVENENELTEMIFIDYFSLIIEKFLAITNNSDPKMSACCDVLINSLKSPKIRFSSDHDDSYPQFLKTVDIHAKKLISDELNKIIN